MKASRRAGPEVVMVVTLLTAMLTAAGGVPRIWADEADDPPLPKVLSGQRHQGEGHDPMAKFLSGQVTASSDRSVSLDGREYAFHPRIVVQDDEGRPKLLRDVVPGMYVRYQLKDNQVRQLILVTPK